MPTWLITVAIGVLQLAFYLGLYVAIIRQSKKDVADLRKEVNGVGGRGRQDALVEDQRFLATALALMEICDPKKREWLAEFLLSAGPRSGSGPK